VNFLQQLRAVFFGGKLRKVPAVTAVNSDPHNKDFIF
jgi:hypothetical protein